MERLFQTDVEQTDGNGKTALMVAAEEGHVDVVNLMLHGGNITLLLIISTFH